MIKRDFELEEMKYFLELLGKSSDNYLYVYDLTNDRAMYTKSILKVFDIKNNEFDNATEVLRNVVHPDDFEMLMQDIQGGIEGRKKEHNLEYRWKTLDGEYAAINCRGQYVLSHGVKYLIGCIFEIGKKSKIGRASCRERV